MKIISKFIYFNSVFGMELVRKWERQSLKGVGPYLKRLGTVGKGWDQVGRGWA